MKTDFAELLKSRRRIMNLSQDDVAKLSGVERSQYAGYEAELREPTLPNVIKLSRVLMFSLCDISIRGEETMFLPRGGM